MAKYLDSNGLTYFWGKIKAYFSNFVKFGSSSGLITIGTTTKTFVEANDAITGATKTKITYDSSGLVTAGADLAEGDIPSLHLSKISDVTATASEVNVLDGITASTSELNILDGVTASTSEINVLDGITATTADLNKTTGIEAGAEVNQNAFSNVKVGSTTIAADSKTDTLEITGSTNITVTPDATNDKITISVTGISNGAEVNQNAFSNIKVGNDTVAADTKTDTVEFVGAGGLTITADTTNDKLTFTAPTGVLPYTSDPEMDGTASAGSSTLYAKGDHVHPTDTSRAADNAVVHLAGNEYITGKKYFSATGTSIVLDTTHTDGAIIQHSNSSTDDFSWIKISSPSKTTNLQSELDTISGSIPSAYTSNPEMDGTASPGSSTAWAKGDHVHPKDTTKADKVVGGTTGNLVALDANGNIVDAGITPSTAGTDTKNTAGATDSSAKLFIVGAEAQTANPQTYTQDTAYVGTDGHLYSNSVQVVNLSGTQTLTNKTLTSPSISSPSMTGTPTAPTATAGTNTTLVATTAFVGTAITNAAANYVKTTEVGVASGVCPLDANAKIDAGYLPSYVDDVVEAYARTGLTALSSTWLAVGSASGSVIVPETGKIYVLMNSTTDYTENSEFRWGGTTYVRLNDSGCSAMSEAEMDTATSNWT